MTPISRRSVEILASMRCWPPLAKLTLPWRLSHPQNSLNMLPPANGAHNVSYDRVLYRINRLAGGFAYAAAPSRHFHLISTANNRATAPSLPRRKRMKSVLRLFAILLLTTVAFPQSDEIAPNENLVAEGIPKIPASLAESANRYGNFRSAGFASWSPVRREMLIVTRFAETGQVHQVKFPGGARTQ